MLQIELIEEERSPVNRATYTTHLQPILKPFFGHDAVVEILLTNDERMRELNRTRRAVDEATDVLSLPTAIDSERGSVVPKTEESMHLGTIVISLDQAQRQVGHFGPTIEDELLGLATHGLRHLLGHDHTDDGTWIE